ncbi:hypothetical protein TWF703_006914 [Orbilia oligospora]|uniref:Uncharacterized protein n=1 Tax=Orbilia oligospora TaxID=2813651 RepID=A0A7C8K2D1_ORBOL|nr:hypothetical protein TWF703_006914 [Orbilia oligospora]
MSSSLLSNIIGSTFPTPTSDDPPQGTLSPESQAEESRMGTIVISTLTGLGGLVFAIALLRACIRKMRGERADGRNEWNPPTPPPGSYDGNWQQYRSPRSRSRRPITVIRGGRVFRVTLPRMPEDAEMGMVRTPSPVARVSNTRNTRRGRWRRWRRSSSAQTQPVQTSPVQTSPSPSQTPSAPTPSITESEDKPPSYRSNTGPPTYETTWDGYNKA